MKKLLKYKKKLVLIIIMLIVIILSIVGFTYSKYVYNLTMDYYFKSKGFYFNSDILSSTSTKNVNKSWNGSSVYFDIRNSLNENVITNYDISYKATCNIISNTPSSVKCYMNGSDSNIYEGVLSTYKSCSNTKNDGVDVSLYNQTTCEVNGYEWIDTEAVKNLYFDIVNMDNSYNLSDITVSISVESTLPYSKKLMGEFILHKLSSDNELISAIYNNYDSYDSLIITNSNSINECVNVNWNSSNLVIDNDINEFNSYSSSSDGYINNITILMQKNSSLEYKFYRKNVNKTYSIKDFNYNIVSDCE